MIMRGVIQLWIRRVRRGTRIALENSVAALPLSLLLVAAPVSLLSQEPPALPSPPEYVGSETCRLCHQDLSIDFQANPHLNQQLEVGGMARSGCETCHGAGGDHANSMNPSLIRRFRTGDTVTESGVCLTCHSREGTHPDRVMDTHSASAVGCVNCHSVHDPGETRKLLIDAPDMLCSSCHASQRSDFRRPFSHPLEAGITRCIDCHAPHGDSGERQLLRSHANESACLACHSDKRGPFTFEHLPTLVGGCGSCHEPHGSANPRMLVRHEVRFLCLECHTNSVSAFGGTPPAFHDLRSSRIQNCTLCHTKIHGSHISPALLR